MMLLYLTMGHKQLTLQARTVFSSFVLQECPTDNKKRRKNATGGITISTIGVPQMAK